MKANEARALLERSENEIEVRYRHDSYEYANIAAQLNLERDVAPREWAEVLAHAAEMELIAFHRHDDEASSEDREVTILYEPMDAARQVANNRQLRVQWERYERGTYNDARARKKFSTNEWPERATLRATAQQVGVFTFAVTDSAGQTYTYYVAGSATIEKWCRYVEARGGEFLPFEIALSAVADHYKGQGMNDAKATEAAIDRTRRRFELHQIKWKQRCEERGYKWQGITSVETCAHSQTEHTPECFLWLADLVECAPDSYLSPHIVSIRARVVATLRYWANKNPQHEKAIQAYNMTKFFGPVGRTEIAGAIAQVINARRR